MLRFTVDGHDSGRYGLRRVPAVCCHLDISSTRCLVTKAGGAALLIFRFRAGRAGCALVGCGSIACDILNNSYAHQFFRSILRCACTVRVDIQHKGRATCCRGE